MARLRNTVSGSVRFVDTVSGSRETGGIVDPLIGCRSLTARPWGRDRTRGCDNLLVPIVVAEYRLGRVVAFLRIVRDSPSWYWVRDPSTRTLANFNDQLAQLIEFCNEKLGSLDVLVKSNDELSRDINSMVAISPVGRATVIRCGERKRCILARTHSLSRCPQVNHCPRGVVTDDRKTTLIQRSAFKQHARHHV